MKGRWWGAAEKSVGGYVEGYACRALHGVRWIRGKAGTTRRRGSGALWPPCPPAFAALRPPPLLTAKGHRPHAPDPAGKASGGFFFLAGALPRRGREAFSRR